MSARILRLTLAVATIFCLTAANNSYAGLILFGAAHLGPDGDSTLVRIDTTTGAATPVGAGIGFERVSGLDFDANAGVLYGTGERSDGSNTHVLITVDTATGVGTEVGPTGVEGFNGVFSGGTFADISFRPSDGTLFAFSFSGEGLASVDLGTGAALQVAFANFNSELGFRANDGNGLAFSSAGTLLHAGSETPTGRSCTEPPPEGGGALQPNCPDLLHTIDPATSMASILTELLFPVPPGATTDESGRINAMDFDPLTGVLTASVVYGFEGDRSNFLGTVNVVSGEVTLIGGTRLGLDAIAFVPVPEPTTILLISLGLAGLGFARRRLH